MCAACHRIWTRSFISDVVEKSGDLLGLRVRELFSLGLASDKVAATIKKEFKDFDLGTGLRPNVIVTMIDERMKDARSNP